MVLERMAAVVNNPHENDFHGLKKKKREKASGELAFNKSEINFRNKRMDAKRRINANPEMMKGLGAISKRVRTNESSHPS